MKAMHNSAVLTLRKKPRSTDDLHVRHLEMSEEYQSMLNKAVQNQSTISSDGRYTSPRTWGTYDLGTAAGKFRRFRYGNHPIRMAELIREHGVCDVVATFYSRKEAHELAALLTSKPSMRFRQTREQKNIG